MKRNTLSLIQENFLSLFLTVLFVFQSTSEHKNSIHKFLHYHLILRIKTGVLIIHNKHFTLGDALCEAPMNGSLSISALPGSHVSKMLGLQVRSTIVFTTHTWVYAYVPMYTQIHNFLIWNNKRSVKDKPTIFSIVFPSPFIIANYHLVLHFY